MIHAQALHFVERYQDPREEEFVLLFERESKSIDDGAQNFQQLSDPIEPLGFIGKLEEDVVDGAADERSQVQELPVDTVQRCLQEIPLPRVL